MCLAAIARILCQYWQKSNHMSFCHWDMTVPLRHALNKMNIYFKSPEVGATPWQCWGWPCPLFSRWWLGKRRRERDMWCVHRTVSGSRSALYLLPQTHHQLWSYSWAEQTGINGGTHRDRTMWGRRGRKLGALAWSNKCLSGKTIQCLYRFILEGETISNIATGFRKLYTWCHA